MSIKKQCEILSISPSTYYYVPRTESLENLALMRKIDEIYLNRPFYGRRRRWAALQEEGIQVNIKRVSSLMNLMGIEAIYPKKQLSKGAEGHKIYPYLIDKKLIKEANEVWSTDITYIPMERGFLYLVAIIDWHSRFILGWELSNTLSTGFCRECLGKSLEKWGKPGIFNSDQGSQFTSQEFTQILINKQIKISMDSKGRALDNIMIERFWRSLKYEWVYIHCFSDGLSLYKGIKEYVQFYNYERLHQNLDYKSPACVYFKNTSKINV